MKHSALAFINGNSVITKFQVASFFIFSFIFIIVHLSCCKACFLPPYVGYASFEKKGGAHDIALELEKGRAEGEKINNAILASKNIPR